MSTNWLVFDDVWSPNAQWWRRKLQGENRLQWEKRSWRERRLRSERRPWSERRSLREKRLWGEKVVVEWKEAVVGMVGAMGMVLEVGKEVVVQDEVNVVRKRRSWWERRSWWREGQLQTFIWRLHSWRHQEYRNTFVSLSLLSLEKSALTGIYYGSSFYIPRLLTFFDNFYTGVKLFKEPLKVEIVVIGTLRVTAVAQMEMVSERSDGPGNTSWNSWNLAAIRKILLSPQ